VQQPELLRYAAIALEDCGIEYALVGSLASSTWGEIRFTQDIDFVVRLSRVQGENLCEAFSGDEFYISLPAVRTAVEKQTQFNVIYPSTHNKIDFMVIGQDGWAKSQIERRQLRNPSGNFECYVAAPEDVILGKLLYYREGGSDKHLRDIRGIFAVSGEIIDLGYLEKWVAELGLIEVWGEARKWIETDE
jgi:hypothetical protein